MDVASVIMAATGGLGAVAAVGSILVLAKRAR